MIVGSFFAFAENYRENGKTFPPENSRAPCTLGSENKTKIINKRKHVMGDINVPRTRSRSLKTTVVVYCVPYLSYPSRLFLTYARECTFFMRFLPDPETKRLLPVLCVCVCVWCVRSVGGPRVSSKRRFVVFIIESFGLIVMR